MSTIPRALPDPSMCEEMREAGSCGQYFWLPQDHLGAVITLCVEKRGASTNLLFLVRQVRLSMISDE